MRRAVRRLWSMDHGDRVLLSEAASLLSAGWLALRVARLATVRRLLCRTVELSSVAAAADRAGTIARVRWAVTRVGARWPFATCLVQALATEAMLARRGIPSAIHIGVRLRRETSRSIEAHAWVESNGSVAVGIVDDLAEFHVIATWSGL